MGSMITVGLKGLASNLATNTATDKGNVLKGLKGLRDKGVVKSVLRSMAMVGLTAGILGNSAIAELDGLPKKLAEAATKATLNMAMDVTIEGVKPGKAAVNAARSTIADSICTTLASQLGQAYHDGNLPDGIVEALHSFVGALNAKIMNEDALSGAIGAIAGEIAGKVYRNANPDKFGDNGHKINNLDRDENVSFATDLAKITAASVATAMNLDPNTAVRTAEIAAVNNALRKTKRALGKMEPTEEEQEDYRQSRQKKQALAQINRDACVEVMAEIAAEIAQDPTGFALKCGEGIMDAYVPGGIENAGDYVFGDKTGEAALKAMGADIALMLATSGQGKGAVKVGKVIKAVKTRVATRVAEKTKVYMIYVKESKKAGKKPYVGRTSGKVSDVKNETELDLILRNRDRNHHMNKEGFGKAEKVKISKNKDAIRGEEQRIIDKFGGAQKTGGTSSNKISGISKNNTQREKYLKTAEKEFGD